MKKATKELIKFWVSLGTGIGIGYAMISFMTPTMIGFSIAGIAAAASYLVIKQSMDEGDNR
jgi:mannose/fructose/N-acetylgalactosamine-specific phosphotransferase system component IIC